MTNVTIPLDTILQALSGLSFSNRRWLAEHLIEQKGDEQVKLENPTLSDEDFFRDLYSTPLESPMTAEDVKRINNHQPSNNILTNPSI